MVSGGGSGWVVVVVGGVSMYFSVQFITWIKLTTVKSMWFDSINLVTAYVLVVLP